MIAVIHDILRKTEDPQKLTTMSSTKQKRALDFDAMIEERIKSEGNKRCPVCRSVLPGTHTGRCIVCHQLPPKDGLLQKLLSIWKR